MRRRAEKAGLRERVRFFYALAGLMLVLPAVAEDRTLADAYARFGAYELSLQMLDQVQAAHGNDMLAWEQAERRRYDLLANLGRWKAILERQSSLPGGASPDFVLWSTVQSVHALLALKDSAAAFDRVQAGIWSAENAPELPIWRSLLVQVYGSSQQDAAQAIAWRRLQQDVGARLPDSTPPDSLELAEYAAARRSHAETLLRKGEYAEAVTALTEDDSIDGRLLFAAAQLLIAGDTSSQVYDLAESIALGTEARLAQRRQALGVMARAATRLKDYPRAIDALVAALDLPAPNRRDGLVLVDADALWAAYESWGLALGGELGLSPEYESGWLDGLEKLDAPRQQLALASVMLLNGRAAQSREQAAGLWLAALDALPQGQTQALWLLNDSERLAAVSADTPKALQLAALRAALHAADVERIRAYRQRRGPVTDPLAEPSAGLLDVHARFLLGEPAAATRFLQEGLNGLGEWSVRSQRDLLRLLGDLEAGGYHGALTEAGHSLAADGREAGIRLQAAAYAGRGMLLTGQYQAAAELALRTLASEDHASAGPLALLAYEALWRADRKADAEAFRQRVLSGPEYEAEAGALRRRLTLPAANPR